MPATVQGREPTRHALKTARGMGVMLGRIEHKAVAQSQRRRISNATAPHRVHPGPDLDHHGSDRGQPSYNGETTMFMWLRRAVCNAFVEGVADGFESVSTGRADSGSAAAPRLQALVNQLSRPTVPVITGTVRTPEEPPLPVKAARGRKEQQS